MSRARAICFLLAATLAGGACDEPVAPALGGEYRVTLETHGDEGSALLELVGPGIEAVSAPAGIVLSRSWGDSTRVILMADPAVGLVRAPLSFRMRMASGASVPQARALEVADSRNFPRDFADTYLIQFSRENASLSLGARSVAGGPLAALDPAALTLARLAAPFLGGSVASPLTAEERQQLDALGNSNGRYDLGDLRRALYEFPQLVP